MTVTSDTSETTVNRRQLTKLVIGFVALASFVGLAGHADATADAQTDGDHTIVEIDAHLDADLVGTDLDNS